MWKLLHHLHHLRRFCCGKRAHAALIVGIAGSFFHEGASHGDVLFLILAILCEIPEA